MANLIVCESNIVQPVVVGVRTLSVAECEGGWTVIPYVEPVIDFQGLVDLLQFNPETFALIFGINILLFITGLGAGHVARILNRH